jgi:hypothetical protein
MGLSLGPASKSRTTLEGEVYAWTDEISTAALAEAIRAILKRVKKIDRRYDIPYVAGYSRDGQTVFIDRHMPRGFNWRVGGSRRMNFSFFTKWSRRHCWTNCTFTIFTRIR